MYGNNCISECHCSEDNCSPAYGCLSIFIFSTPFFVSLLLSNHILKNACGFLICRMERWCHKAFTEISDFTLNYRVAHNECKWLDPFFHFNSPLKIIKGNPKYKNYCVYINIIIKCIIMYLFIFLKKPLEMYLVFF